MQFGTRFPWRVFDFAPSLTDLRGVRVDALRQRRFNVLEPASSHRRSSSSHSIASHLVLILPASAPSKTPFMSASQPKTSAFCIACVNIRITTMIVSDAITNGSTLPTKDSRSSATRQMRPAKLDASSQLLQRRQLSTLHEALPQAKPPPSVPDTNQPPSIAATHALDSKHNTRCCGMLWSNAKPRPMQRPSHRSARQAGCYLHFPPQSACS